MLEYSEKLRDHFFNPRNVGTFDKDDPDVATGVVGSPVCGDMMQLQLKIVDGRVKDARFTTFGCGAAIASSSFLTELVKGMTIEEVSRVKNEMIAKELSLPPIKVHCSVLAEDALKAAIQDYNKKKNTLGQKEG
jgi:nitrogen fixation NifU-like protein